MGYRKAETEMNSWELVRELKKRADTFRKLDAECKDETMLISQEMLALSRKFYTLVEELYEIGRQLNSIRRET